MSFDRKKYAREYARRKRAEKLAARNASATTCQARMGLHGVCGGLLEAITDGAGRAAIVCPLCERKRRGICRDCGLPVEGRKGFALRCAHHKGVEASRAAERYRTRDPERYRSNARRVYQRDKAKRKARNEYKRLWRKANRDKVRAQNRRANLRGRGAEAQARRRAKLGIVTAPRSSELRTCLTPGCDIVVTGRKKKCTRCREREQREAAARLAALRGAA